MKYKTIFWDFNGVISHDYFFSPIRETHPQVWDYIQTKIFGLQSNGLINRWMRGEVDVNYVQDLIINDTGVDEDVLLSALKTGATNFALEPRHFPIIKQLKDSGIKVGLVTDNMDVFDLYINSHYHFENIFDIVVNSFPHKLLKKEGLFDIAMQQIGSTDYGSALLVEDSVNSTNYFKSHGGNAFVYTKFELFETWAKDNLLK